MKCSLNTHGGARQEAKGLSVAHGSGCWRWSVRARVALVENCGRWETRLSSFPHSKRADDQSLNVSRTEFFIASKYPLSPAPSAWRTQVPGDTCDLCPSLEAHLPALLTPFPAQPPWAVVSGLLAASHLQILKSSVREGISLCSP